MAEPAKLNVVAPVEPASQPSSTVAALQSPTAQDLPVHQLLVTSMIKVSGSKQKQYDFRLDPDEGQMSWKTKTVPIEAIKEIRSGPDARYDREQFRVGQECENRWLTVIYILDGNYKTLHMIAPTEDIFHMWDTTLRKLHAIRQVLMSGLGHLEIREKLWENQYWKGADQVPDKKLDFQEVERICRRLNNHLSNEELNRIFKKADTRNRGYLDIDDFRQFVKMMKQRPEIDRLHKKLCSPNGYFDYPAFEKFMLNAQRSTAPKEDLVRLFDKYATTNGGGDSPQASPVPAANPSGQAVTPPATRAVTPPASKTVAPLATQPQTQAADPPLAKPTAAPAAQVASPQTTQPAGQAAAPQVVKPVDPPTTQAAPLTPAASLSTAQATPPAATPGGRASTLPVTRAVEKPGARTASLPATLVATPSASQTASPAKFLTIANFTSFLLSQDNPAFSNINANVYQDMTRPLSEYYISSSHNTYLVGHQLVGVSTIEGYIRALLHGCRSVELDVYDGDPEPVVYHGKTLTSKVPVRDICQAILKYAFVTSPYPVIISAEVHCGSASQDHLFAIMTEVFGDALVNAPIGGRPKITVLPSPEDLKERFLLKAKSTYTSDHEPIQDKEVLVDFETTTTETSDSDVSQGLEAEWKKVKEQEQDTVAELRQEIKKAKNFIQRVRQHSPIPSLKSPKKKSAGSGPRQATMSFKLASLLVYTVGVKCRGINKKEAYAPEHVFSLSENTAHKMLKESRVDLVKHTRTHIVRTYPKGLRLGSSNYEPHHFWSAGAQLVAINWQTCDLGYTINHTMFQRNGRAGYILKPLALRSSDKDLLSKRTRHAFDATIISAQQLPRPKDANGREIIDKSVVDPFVEVSLHIPDWNSSPFSQGGAVPSGAVLSPPPGGPPLPSPSPAKTLFFRTATVKNNGFNPVWEEGLSLPFDCVGDMLDLIFVRFAVKQEDKADGHPLASYCTSLGSLEQGYRHLPLHDAQLSQYLFSTLFVRIAIRNL